ncbi:MAG: hypothetical protein WCH57_09060 [Verrucomicrobiota bacterium]
MNHLFPFLYRTRCVMLILVVAFQMPMGGIAQEMPAPELPKRGEAVAPLQSEKVQEALIEARGTRAEARTRYLLMGSALMFLFGAFGALWAQNGHRNPVVWFFAGFFFTILTVVAILWLNPKYRKRKRYRRAMAYWNF